MSREIPTLSDLVIKVIARYPSKCMTEEACGELLDAITKGCFSGVDIIQLVVSNIIEAGRMTDEGVHPSIFLNRSVLSLANSKISGKYLLRAIGYCYKTLTSLDVSGCFQVDDDKLKSVVERCPNLVEINAKNCRKLTDTLLHNLVNQNSTKIISLNIGGNFNITDSGVRLFVENYRYANNMQDLIISGLVVSDETILAITKRFRSLKTLGLAYLDLHETTLQELFTKIGVGLERIDLSWPSTTPMARNPQPSCPVLIDNLSRCCPNLFDLDISGNKNFTVADVTDLIERRLYLASIEGCRPIEVLKLKFIGSAKGTLESKLTNAYINLRILF